MNTSGTPYPWGEPYIQVVPGDTDGSQSINVIDTIKDSTLGFFDIVGSVFKFFLQYPLLSFCLAVGLAFTAFGLVGSAFRSAKR